MELRKLLVVLAGLLVLAYAYTLGVFDDVDGSRGGGGSVVAARNRSDTVEVSVVLLEDPRKVSAAEAAAAANTVYEGGGQAPVSAFGDDGSPAASSSSTPPPRRSGADDGKPSIHVVYDDRNVSLICAVEAGRPEDRARPCAMRRADVLGSRRLAMKAECPYDRVRCESLGRAAFDPTVRTSVADARSNVAELLDTIVDPWHIDDTAIRRARRFAREKVSEWAARMRRGAGSSSNGGGGGGSSPSSLFPTAQERRLQFYPFYTLLRGLEGFRLQMLPNGSFAYEHDSSNDADAARRLLAESPHFHSMRRLSDAMSQSKGATWVTDLFRDQLEARFRLNLSTVPVPFYHDYEALFYATTGASFVERRGAGGEGSDEREAAMKKPLDEQRIVQVVDHMALPPAAKVLEGQWPHHNDAGENDGDVASRLQKNAGVFRTFDQGDLGKHSMVDERDGLPEWTRHAQLTIARSQELPLVRDEHAQVGSSSSSSVPEPPPPPTDEMLAGGDPPKGWRREFCNETRLLVAKLLNTGLGANIRMASINLAHAMLSGRRLIYHPKWPRWAGVGGMNVCANAGWMCYFLPPSPCDPYKADMFGRGKGVPADPKHPLLSGAAAAARIAVVPEHRTRDLRMVDVPDLHPPGVTRKDVEAKTGMAYHHWAQLQLLRYLLRGLQPWAEVMVLQELRRAGYPWSPAASSSSADSQGSSAAPPRPIVATHFRNGDTQYNLEVRPVLKCGQLDTSLTVAIYEEAAWSIEKLLRDENASDASSSVTECAVKPFFSFDHFRAVEHARKWFTDSVASLDPSSSLASSQLPADLLDTATMPPCVVGKELRADVPVLNTSVSFGRQRMDARDLMKRAFGEGYLMRVSLGNLFLAAGADAWVNNDASNWAKLVNTIRYTGGRRWHDALYIDIVDFADQAGEEGMMPFCNSVGLVAWQAARWIDVRNALAAKLKQQP